MESFVINYLLPIIGSFLAIVGTYIATIAARWITAKMGANLSAEQEVAIDKAITDAVWAAEEKGAAALKDSGCVDHMTKDMKYRYVLNFIANRFPELTKAEADAKIHGIIGKTAGLGSTSDPVCNPPKETKIREDIQVVSP